MVTDLPRWRISQSVQPGFGARLLGYEVTDLAVRSGFLYTPTSLALAYRDAAWGSLIPLPIHSLVTHGPLLEVHIAG